MAHYDTSPCTARNGPDGAWRTKYCKVPVQKGTLNVTGYNIWDLGLYMLAQT